jgi:AmmeMemoRadiSam system protein B
MDFAVSTAGKGRAPIVSGLFYPDEKHIVLEKLRSFGLETGSVGEAQAIIAPHGAWDISGEIAGKAFLAAAGRKPGLGQSRTISQVVLLGCIHDVKREGIFLSDSHYFETPLGNLKVNMEINEELCSCSNFIEINDTPHLIEHTLEVLLPFVKFYFPQAAIIPILLGGVRPALISALAHALHIVFKPILDATLLAVSANLSMNANPAAAHVQAETCVHRLETPAADDFTTYLSNGGITACGGGAVAALLQSGLLMNKTGKLLTSPLINALGEEGKTVYYGALAYY